MKDCPTSVGPVMFFSSLATYLSTSSVVQPITFLNKEDLSRITFLKMEFYIHIDVKCPRKICFARFFNPRMCGTREAAGSQSRVDH